MLTARKLMQWKLYDIEMSLRGILRGFGIKVGPTTASSFAAQSKDLVALPPVLQAIACSDARVRLLMSAPGVGAIVTTSSWLNLIKGFFSKLARSVLRHIRVVSKQELAGRILAAIDDINQQPVVHTWSYKLDNAA